MTTLPKYAVDLLMAAKPVASPAIDTTLELRREQIRALEAAVIAFEAAMPVVAGGVIVTTTK